MDDVEEKDLGFGAALDRILQADGLQLKIGITGRPRYPGNERKRVAQVAAVWQKRNAWLSIVLDGRDSKWKGEQTEILERAKRGEKPVNVAKEVGTRIQGDMRAMLESLGLVDTGKLRDSIGVYVTDPGARKRAWKHIKARGYKRK